MKMARLVTAHAKPTMENQVRRFSGAYFFRCISAMMAAMTQTSVRIMPDRGSISIEIIARTPKTRAVISR